MPTDDFERLVQDAGLVADVAVRLGALKDENLLGALTAAKLSLAEGNADPVIVAALQRALNAAIKGMHPITLADLRRGWRPYEPVTRHSIGISFFFIFSLVLMAVSAYTTQVYERARAMYATTLELQEARGAEQAMRLFGMLKRNQKDVAESLKSGQKEFLYEVFSKSLFDLKAMYLKSQAYLPIAADVLNDLEMIASPTVAWKRLTNPENPSDDQKIRDLLKSKPIAYGPVPPSNPSDIIGLIGNASAPDGSGVNPADVQTLLEAYLGQLGRFNQSINVLINPLEPTDYFSNLFRLRLGMGFVGLWVLPGLYGMLGAVIYHMRRLLDPASPDLSWIRIVFRVLLGAFAGIIIVWFWTPSSQKVSQGEFVTLTSFGLAFLVGFSTDVFFRALDRVVGYLTQAVEGAKSS